MRRISKTPRAATVLAASLALIGLFAGRGSGDEPQSSSRLGRLFRFGSGNAAQTLDSNARAHDPGSQAGQSKPSAAPTDYPATTYTTVPTPTAPPSTPELQPNPTASRIAPQPRVSRPPTDADPVVTRIAIGRSDNGGQFGMFLQVFADGTVLDTEGVHRLSGEVMRPLLDTLRQGELYRLKGHCGAPSTDFIEQAHVIIYDRSYGKLRATSFSYSGNPQGCDPAVRRLHAALDAIQMKLSAPASETTPRGPSAEPSSTSAVTPGSRAPAVLGLTPPNP